MAEENTDTSTDSMAEDIVEKTTKKKKTSFFKKDTAKKPVKTDDSKHIKSGVCQICGAWISRGQKHTHSCRLSN